MADRSAGHGVSLNEKQAQDLLRRRDFAVFEAKAPGEWVVGTVTMTVSQMIGMAERIQARIEGARA